MAGLCGASISLAMPGIEGVQPPDQGQVPVVDDRPVPAGPVLGGDHTLLNGHQGKFNRAGAAIARTP